MTQLSALRVALHHVDMRHAMAAERKKRHLTPLTLRLICGLNGYRTVSDLAVRVGRHRTTVHLAVRYPERYGPTFHAIDAALPRR